MPVDSLSQVKQPKHVSWDFGSALRYRLSQTTAGRMARAARSALRSARQNRDVAEALERVRPFSMVPEERLVHLGELVKTILATNVPGAFVECGVWRGGASFLMADLLKRAGAANRTVWLCDSFEGHRPPEEIDGAAALEYARNTDSPAYRDNCRVAMEAVQQSARSLDLAEYTRLVKGWFDETLPAHREAMGPIALLRVDCDWYSSVRCCLEQLYDQVSPGGFIIFDDYFDYDGCSIAVHEWLAERQLKDRLQTINGTAVIRKV
jgi:O-methyltransferase